MVVELASIGDIDELAKVQALQAGKKILGVTSSPARYVQVPDGEDPDAVFEFVVDVRLLDGVSQAVVVGSTFGAVFVPDVLIAHSIAGDVIADINTPVEIELNQFGQLQVVNRAKVKLPALSVTSYTYTQLELAHLAEFDITAEGIFDPFGYPADNDPTLVGPEISTTVSTSTRLASFGELAPIWGVNPFQRIIQQTVRTTTYGFSETMEPTTEIEVT